MHSLVLCVGRGVDIAILVTNLTTSITIANRCASLPRNPLLAIPG